MTQHHGFLSNLPPLFILMVIFLTWNVVRRFIIFRLLTTFGWRLSHYIQNVVVKLTVYISTGTVTSHQKEVSGFTLCRAYSNIFRSPPN